MDAVQKHGALWLTTIDKMLGVCVFEQYYPDKDLIAAVFERNGLFKAATFAKGSLEPQWAGSWWGEREPYSLFGCKTEAVEYVRNLIASPSGPSEAGPLP